MRTNIKLTGLGLLASFAGLWVAGNIVVAQQAPRENLAVQDMTTARPLDHTIIQTVARYMDRQHLSKHRMDDEISKRAFDQFLRALDPLKLYFLQSDIEAFHSSLTRLDDYALAGKMDFAIDAFKTFLKRVDERVEMAHAAIDSEHDFTVAEKLAIDRDVIEYPASDAEAQDRMRRQIKYQLLVLESEKIQADKDKESGKELTDTQRVLAADPNEDPRERLHRRYRTIHKRWHQTDADELLEIYVSAITTSFDPHTSYMSPDTLDNFRIVMSLNLDGIGAQLMSEDGYTKLTSIVPGGAADKDGRLKPGDKIVQVAQGEDGMLEDVVDMKLDDVVHRIRGTAGTVVRLGVMPAAGGELQIYDITRAKITLDDSAARSEVVEYGKKADGQPFKFGYIDLPSFYMDMQAARDNSDSFRSTTRDVSLILSDFRAQKVDAVVLDLSRNGGGSLTEAINLTGLFVDQGPVVQVKNPQGQVDVYDDSASGVAWDGPLVVMTSKESASASEILAGAIQDYRRGIIVGDPTTHGKGTVQSLIDLGEQLMGIPGEMGALKLTIQQFYLPGGKSTQRAGVLSDVVLPAITASIDNSESDLDYALPNDTVREAKHMDYKMVDGAVLGILRANSTQRVSNSKGFEKLFQRIEMFKQQKDEDYVSLKREDFLRRRNELDAQREEQTQALDSQVPKKDVFKMDYYNEEILNVAKDYVEAMSKLDLAQAS
ncbi:carboxy terminal-processing peptidase [Aureliella helgolandensis]|uniref:Tail-specific protease n=1 Tax=Aureliella helgolandensis TaxID=2527968 RepID=A0A518G9Z8_9BACT|nr:carboxy terminal-processing peptidase [Aureliella helgolandensis]QDV25416.1 Tail-specific protease precursor [Aureliella helgolandensis]